MRSNPSNEQIIEGLTRKDDRDAPSLSVNFPKTAPGTQDDAPSLEIDH